MKLFRFGDLGHEKPGAVDAQGHLRDLSLLIDDFTPDWLAPEKLAAVSAIDLSKMPLVPGGARLGTLLPASGNLSPLASITVKHAEEAGMEIPKEPVVFNKALTSLAGPNDAAKLPEDSVAGDWEVELGVVIGRTAQRVTQKDALSYVAGYCLANDLSERDWQAKRNGQWVKGKSFDGFGPIGPWLVTTDEIPDPQTIPLELAVNGKIMQKSNTADMIFPVAQIVAYLSQFMTLLPGDVIITGTPEGVGLGMKPPQHLKRGDVVTLAGGILGSQRQEIL